MSQPARSPEGTSSNEDDFDSFEEEVEEDDDDDDDESTTEKSLLEEDDILGEMRRRSGIARNQARESSAKMGMLVDDFQFLPKENLARLILNLGPDRLEVINSVEVATVLEELSDRLDVISNSIDTPPIDIRQRKSVLSDLALHRPMLHLPPAADSRSDYFAQERWILTQHYRSVIPRRLRQYAKNDDNIRKDPTYMLRLHGIKKFTEKGKVQADRTDLQVIVDIAVAELVQNSTFQKFICIVDQEEASLKQMTDMVQKSIDYKEKFEHIKRETKQVRRDKVASLTSMDHAIYNLHDATQEMIRRKEMEASYIKKCGSLWVKRMKKICAKAENVVETELKDLKLAVQEEDRCHNAMKTVLQAKFSYTEERLEYWMDKYDVEKEILQTELDTLKSNRERDLKRIAWLKFMIRDYLQICRDDRRMKNKLAEEERVHQLKIRKAIRLQSWWRGEMVRKMLGPFRPTREPAPKKGDKKGKGK